MTEIEFIDGKILKGGLWYSVENINQVNDVLLDVNYVSGTYIYDTTYEVGQTIVNGVLQETMEQMITTFDNERG
jgi:hypothetical protein